MKNVVIKIFFLIFLMFNLTACGQKQIEQKDLLLEIKEKGVFVVGINDASKPFGYVDDLTGEMAGFDADLIRLLAESIFGNSNIIKFEKVTPSNRILKLNRKDVDVVISTMTINRERLNIIDFSNPYYVSGQAILVRKNSNIRSGKDLNKKRVGIVLGTTAALNIHYIAPQVRIKGFKNYKNAFKELEKENLDAISTDAAILQGIILDNPNYKILPDRYSTEFYGIALRKDANSQNLKDAINQALNKVERNGSIQALEKKYDIFQRR